MHCINNMNKIGFGISVTFCILCSCTSRTGDMPSTETLQTDSLMQDTIAETAAEPVVKTITPEQIHITKELLYDNIRWKTPILIRILPAIFSGIR